MPTLPDNLNLPQLQAYIKALCAEKGWDKNSHLEIFLLFTEEIGELAKAIRQHEKLHLAVEHPTSDSPTTQALADEFADVLNYLLDLANYFDIDLETAFRNKNTKNEMRQWH